MVKWIVGAGICLVASGCVTAVTTAADVAGTAVKTTAKIGASAAGAAVDVATPDGGKDRDDDDRKRSTAHHDDHRDEPRPFDASRNAMLDVDAALAASRNNGKKALLVLGGNWCHDSRGLASKFEEPELAALIEDRYELVWVDVGHRDRNLDVGARFGVPELYGTPTVLILSPEGELLNRLSVHDWRTAYSKSYEETYGYFADYAEQ
ncbi:MAG: thioredoxin family protein [Pseudomonadota bacterium]